MRRCYRAGSVNSLAIATLSTLWCQLLLLMYLKSAELDWRSGPALGANALEEQKCYDTKALDPTTLSAFVQLQASLWLVKVLSKMQPHRQQLNVRNITWHRLRYQNQLSI